MPSWQRFTALATVVVTVHAAGLWALNAYKLPTSLDNQAPALQTRAIEPLQLPQLQQPSPPVSTSKAPLAPVNPKPVVAAGTAAPLKPAAEPAATAPLLVGKLPSAAPSAPKPPTGNYAPAPNAATTTSSAAPVAASAVNSATTVAAAGKGVSASEQVVQLPSVDADHVDTQYRHLRPAISTRLGESGRVIVSVLVGLNGKPLQVLVVKSSGFDRLDDNAVKTVMRWRFRPGTQNGVPTVMSVTQPVDYELPN
jgi:periplasmic protein TonB